ncbi:MAG: SpoIID/LytB domain-containing protein [Quinella sp. 2Q5]|nr:SpoIID/LytB domain-containing protein [Quinella sp. 2Q5]
MRKIFVALMVLLLLTGTACAEKKSAWSPEMRIGLTSGVKRVELKVSAACVLIDTATGKRLSKIPAEKKFVIDAAKLKVDTVEVRPKEIRLQDLQTTIDGKKFFGGVRLNKVRDTLTVINLVPTEEYLRGVVAKEMMPSYPLEALKAQTVAARSFAMKNRSRHETEGFDLCATTHCQVYDGYAEFDAVNRAVEETRGRVLMFKNKIADANFHTDSGGMTENVADVWGTYAPYLVAVKELLTLGEPWTVKVTAKDFSAHMGEGFGEVKSFKLSPLTIGKDADDRSSSGRVKSMQIVGTKKTVKLTGADLRLKFSLPSTLFDIKLDGEAVIFEGYGRGHGVGMSQLGAKAYATDGWSYEKILAHYYRGAQLKKVY